MKMENGQIIAMNKRQYTYVNIAEDLEYVDEY